MKNKTKRNVIRSIATALILTTTISAYSNLKKTGKYNASYYNGSIINEYSFENLESYVLQGGCTDDIYTYVTAYDNSKKNNSIIYVLDETNNIINTVDVGSKTHIGGITYDYDHNNIWITDTKGTITAFNRDDLINNTNPTPVYKNIDIAENDLKNDHGNPSVSAITYELGHIYASSYSYFNNAKLKVIDVLEDGSINTNKAKVVDFINNVQGLALISKNDQIYLIANTSHGVGRDSILKFYKYDETITDYKNEWYKFYRIPPMGEGIFFDKNNNLNIINESNANKYNLFANYCFYDAEDITTLHTDTLTKRYKHW